MYEKYSCRGKSTVVSERQSAFPPSIFLAAIPTTRRNSPPRCLQYFRVVSTTAVCFLLAILHTFHYTIPPIFSTGLSAASGQHLTTFSLDIQVVCYRCVCLCQGKKYRAGVLFCLLEHRFWS